MGWIDINDEKHKLPKGLQVLLEVSGSVLDKHGCILYADHDYYIGCLLVPSLDEEERWYIDTDAEFLDFTVHAWMPLPKHYQPREKFGQEEDLMEHPMFETEPDWLYRDDVVYEQMSIEDFLGGKQ